MTQLKEGTSCATVEAGKVQPVQNAAKEAEGTLDFEQEVTSGLSDDRGTSAAARREDDELAASRLMAEWERTLEFGGQEELRLESMRSTSCRPKTSPHSYSPESRGEDSGRRCPA